MLATSVSLHQIKKQSGASLRQWLELEHGPPTSEGFLRAQNNFVESAAAYALTSYLLQLKDREDEKMVELEVELSKIKWDILGLSEVRREGEDTMTLESGHMLYHREGDQLSQGGVGFLVNKTLVNNVVEISSVSNRVAYLVLKLTERYSL
ncbi:unnamed protein product [Plutella xylostella]|uniref:(diamondback moth) hypothetical protein n=1 Tax=Plutella xylostella TaxID=51655 RepID=A0A8S4G1S3_PLUXY|nr:unnamed protein product [Plutella xylostella]